MALNSGLSQEEKKFYHRHIILDRIGTVGQNALKQSKVLVIGAGGLGCPVLQYLVAAGVGTIGIVDGDTVATSNLHRQILYTTNDIGQPKAHVAQQKLNALNPFVTIRVYPYYLNTDNALSLFSAYDIVVDGSDNFPTRYLVNDASVITHTPVVFGSLFKFQGQVSVFNYKGSGTYRCLYPTPPQAGSVPNCSDIGVLGVLPGIIGCLQANEAIKMILGIGEVMSNKLVYVDALTLNQQILTFARTEEADVKELQKSYESFCGIDETPESLTLSEIQNRFTDYTFLDVRTSQEYEDHNVGGLHIPLDELSARHSEIPKAIPVAVCCASGVRSQKAIAILKELNFEIPLLNIKGGIHAIETRVED